MNASRTQRQRDCSYMSPILLSCYYIYLQTPSTVFKAGIVTCRRGGCVMAGVCLSVSLLATLRWQEKLLNGSSRKFYHRCIRGHERADKSYTRQPQPCHRRMFSNLHGPLATALMYDSTETGVPLPVFQSTTNNQNYDPKRTFTVRAVRRSTALHRTRVPYCAVVHKFNFAR